MNGFSPHSISWRLRVITLSDGTRAGVLDAVVPDDAPHEVKEGFARRSLANGGGQCPCGARLIMPNRAARRRGAVTPVTIAHGNDCPATDRNLRAAMEAGR